MSTRIASETAQPIIESADELAGYFARGEKPRTDWRLGTEHEKFVFWLEDHRPPTYYEPGGIADILHGFERFGWQPVQENGQTIAMRQGGASISLEPAGQFELSGAPLESIHQTCAEVGGHLRQCKEVGAEFGLGMLGHGFWPNQTRAAMPMMPKARYEIMRNYMPKVGNLGLDMMLRTATIQVNLDYASEADMVQKFRVSLALQPLATALFANSPFTEGKPNGYLSYRSHIWTDTDPDRTGVPSFVFEDGFGYERYAQYMLDMPMYFVFREGRYIDMAGQSFRDFLTGQLPGLAGERPTIEDWSDHLSTAFPEVRMKTFLEMRGADGGPWARICALPALWAGLLYDQVALDAAWDLVKDWSDEDHQQLRREVPRLGLNAQVAGTRLQQIALEALRIADQGLKNRAMLDAGGSSEQGFLAALWDVAQSGQTPAERLLADYHGPWQGDVTRLFAQEAF